MCSKLDMQQLVPVAAASLCHRSGLLRYRKHKGASESFRKPKYMRNSGDCTANCFHLGSVLPARLARMVLKKSTCKPVDAPLM